MIKFCPNCGKKLKSIENFCPQCGYDISKRNEVQSQENMSSSEYGTNNASFQGVSEDLGVAGSNATFQGVSEDSWVGTNDATFQEGSVDSGSGKGDSPLLACCCLGLLIWLFIALL